MTSSWKALSAFSGWAGPRSPGSVRMLVIGEAWGRAEAACSSPLVGESGRLFFDMLGQAIPEHRELYDIARQMYDEQNLGWRHYRDDWLTACGIAYTNLINARPSEGSNDFESLCTTKKEALGRAASLPPIVTSPKQLYLREEVLAEWDRLRDEIMTVRPNLILVLGNKGAWSVLQSTAISSIRGTCAPSVVPGLEGLKCLPTYHPAAVLRQWSWYTIVVTDLLKAWRQAQFPEIRRPARRVLISPSLDEAQAWFYETLDRSPALLSIDTETSLGQISMVSFARSRDDVLVVPFIDEAKPEWSYWSSIHEELAAWSIVRGLIESSIPKLFQNGVYDLQFFMRMGFAPRALAEDTMLLHHSFFPEMPKGLGFLGSVYTDEPAWKLMRRRKAAEVMSTKLEE